MMGNYSTHILSSSGSYGEEQVTMLEMEDIKPSVSAPMPGSPSSTPYKN